VLPVTAAKARSVWFVAIARHRCVQLERVGRSGVHAGGVHDDREGKVYRVYALQGTEVVEESRARSVEALWECSAEGCRELRGLLEDDVRGCGVVKVVWCGTWR
jgi:hypothetical protein